MDEKPIIILGLLGQNIQYSLSPKIHHSSAKKLGIEISYTLIDLAPDQVANFIKDFWIAGGTGFNVTTPYKELVAKLIGSQDSSINTVFRGKDGWQGESTDGEGFVASLKHMGLQFNDLDEITFLGSGGAVVGILQHIAKRLLADSKRTKSIRINILRRKPKRDQIIRDIAHPHFHYKFYDFEPQNLKQVVTRNPKHLIVQATSAPAQGNSLSDFTDAIVDFQGQFYDLDYSHASALLQESIKRRIVCLNGLAMLVEQAMLAQTYWFGKSEYPDMRVLSGL